MSHPVKVGGPDPRYTPEALAREIEGTMTVKCVVTAEGAVRGCRVLRGLPFLDGAVVEALERRRYRPAVLAGSPVDVDYVFRISMRLP
jgi:protein TonB